MAFASLKDTQQHKMLSRIPRHSRCFNVRRTVQRGIYKPNRLATVIVSIPLVLLNFNTDNRGTEFASRRLTTMAAAPQEAKKTEYVPPKVWEYKPQGGKFGSINKPTAGPRTEKELPKGKHALQLHSLATPNGVKVTMMLEELNEIYGLEYDAWKINIMEGDQFGSRFVKANPNSKIPALLHYHEGADKKPRRVFESASILMYLAEQFDEKNHFLPKDVDARSETISWVMWQMGSAPYLGGGFGHFYNYAPVKIEYAINRFTMEAKRQLDVLERHLSGKEDSKFSGGKYIVGDTYTIADMAIWPWYGALALGKLYSAGEFLQVDEYPNVVAWAKRIGDRKGTIRGRMVNRSWGEKSEQLPERHDASDFDKLLSSEK